MISLPNLVKFIPIMTPYYYSNRFPQLDTSLRHQPMHTNTLMVKYVPTTSLY